MAARGEAVYRRIDDSCCHRYDALGANASRDLELTSVLAVGCKADLQAERQVSQQEVEAQFSASKIQVFETSAKTGTGLEAPFLHVLKKVRFACPLY